MSETLLDQLLDAHDIHAPFMATVQARTEQALGFMAAVAMMQGFLDGADQAKIRDEWHQAKTTITELSKIAIRYHAIASAAALDAEAPLHESEEQTL